MPLFKCSKCKCVENTACSDYWIRRLDKDEALCSECSTGKWHGMFEKVNAEEKGYYRDKDGFIYSPDEVDTKKMVWKYNNSFKIVGKA